MSGHPRLTVLRLRPDAHAHLAAGLAALHAACIEHDHTIAYFLPPLDAGEMAAWWGARLAEVGADAGAGGSSRGILAVVEGDGFVAGVVMLDQPAAQTGRHRGGVDKFLVSPERRRRGVGRALMAALERVAVGAGRWLLLLDTEAGSEAEAVYPRLSFVACGSVPDYEVSPKEGRLVANVFFYKDLRRPGALLEPEGPDGRGEEGA